MSFSRCSVASIVLVHILLVCVLCVSAQPVQPQAAPAAGSPAAATAAAAAAAASQAASRASAQRVVLNEFNSFITNVVVVAGPSGKDIPCPNGTHTVASDPQNPTVKQPIAMDKDKVNMNEGAGGKDLYLCRDRMPVKSQVSALVKVTLKSTEMKQWTCNAPLLATINANTNAPADLNDEAGGNYIFMCKEGSDQPQEKIISDIMVVSQSDCPAPYESVNDMNKQAILLNDETGGSQLFMCVKYADDLRFV
jgi:hypothetical protein